MERGTGQNLAHEEMSAADERRQPQMKSFLREESENKALPDTVQTAQ
jgi:hypothetical protein